MYILHLRLWQLCEKIQEMHVFCEKLWTFCWAKCQKCNASQCDDMKLYMFHRDSAYFSYYTVCNLQNQSISLSCMLALLSIVLAARNNFLFVAVIVFVHTLCIVRSTKKKLWFLSRRWHTLPKCYSLIGQIPARSVFL